MNTILTMCLPAEIRFSRLVSGTAGKIAEIFSADAGCSGDTDGFIHAFELSVAEAFSNAVRHAGSPERPGKVNLSFSSGSDGLTVSVSDTNPAFLPEVPAPDIFSYPERGYGLFLIHQLMDEVRYSRDSGINLLSMTKKPFSLQTP